jgi:hypothetical protein
MVVTPSAGRGEAIRARRAAYMGTPAGTGAGRHERRSAVAGVPWQLPWQQGIACQPGAPAPWRQQHVRLPRQQQHTAGRAPVLPVSVRAGASGERHSNSHAAMRRAATVLPCLIRLAQGPVSYRILGRPIRRQGMLPERMRAPAEGGFRLGMRVRATGSRGDPWPVRVSARVFRAGNRLSARSMGPFIISLLTACPAFALIW